MSQLYQEALVEAEKLFEVASADAQKKIIEAVTPYIKKIIASEADTSKFLFGEEDQMMDDSVAAPPMDTTAGLPPTEEPGMVPGDVPNAAPISPMDSLVGMPMPDDEGKITVDFQQLFSMGGGGALAPAPGGELGNVAASKEASPPVGPEGGADVNVGGEMAPVVPVEGGIQAPPEAGAGFGAPEAGAAAASAGQGEIQGQTPGIPQEINPEETEPTPIIAGEARIKGFQNDVYVVAEKIDYIYFTGNAPSLVKESLKSKLFTLCEKLDDLVNEGVVSSKKARLAENKLEFLFIKLNEAEQKNSYKEVKGVQMTTLREFAAKLFEEDALGPATADKATAHAEKVSGVQPGVDLFKEGDAPQTDEVKTEDSDLEAMTEALLGEDAPASSAFGDGKLEGDAENKTPEVHDADALAKEKGAGIVESAPASSAFGDGEKASGAENTSKVVHDPNALADEAGANTILEFDEKELREAVAKLRKENLARKLAAVKKEAALKGTDKDGHLKPPSVPEGDQGSAKPEGGKDPSQKNLKECGMTAEGDMQGGDMAPAVGSMPMEDIGPGLEDMAGAGDEEVELTFQIDVDDLEALLNGSVADFIAEPEGEVEAAEGPEGDAESLAVVDDGGEEDEMLLDKEEDKPEMPMESKKPTSKPSVNEAKVVKALKTQLNEAKLLTAKSLYVSKFAVREDLTTKQKQKIAEYFDKAKTLAEAKKTYNKIKKILAENTPSTKLSGSSSKATATGSARLNESNTSAGAGEIESARWMLLAGIKSKK